MLSEACGRVLVERKSAWEWENWDWSHCAETDTDRPEAESETAKQTWLRQQQTEGLSDWSGQLWLTKQVTEWTENDRTPASDHQNDQTWSHRLRPVSLDTAHEQISIKLHKIEVRHDARDHARPRDPGTVRLGTLPFPQITSNTFGNMPWMEKSLLLVILVVIKGQPEQKQW